MIFLKKTFVVLIAVLLLISSSGIFVMIHTCIGSKKTEISFSDEHKCCNNKKKSKKACNIERKCCSVDYQYHKLNVVSHSSEENTTPEIILSETTLFDINILSIERPFHLVYHSPPLLIRDIFVQFHQLLI